MERRRFLIASGSAILSGSGAFSTQKPVIGVDFDLSGIPDTDPSNIDKILVDFNTFQITPFYIDDNKSAEIVVKLKIDSKNQTPESKSTISLTNGETKNAKNMVDPLVVDEIGSDDFITGKVVVSVSHPNVSDEYIRKFNISGEKIIENGFHHYYGNDGEEARYLSLSTRFDINSNGFSYNQTNLNDGQLILNRDGTKGLFKEDNTNNLTELNLSTPFDPTTASEVRTESHDGDKRGGICAYGSNLDKLLYSSGGKSGSTVYEYNLNDTFDLSTFSLDKQHDLPKPTSWGNWFNDDGSKWYSASLTDDKFYQFNLNKSFDLSSVKSTDSMSDGITDSSTAIVTGTNGDILYTFHHSPHNILRHDLETPYDITTANNKQDFGEEFQQDIGQYMHAPPWY